MSLDYSKKSTCDNNVKIFLKTSYNAILCDIFEITHRDNFRFKVDFNVLPPSQLCCKYHFFSIINTLYSKAVLAEFRQYFHYSTNNKDSVDTPNILFSWMTFELTKQNESE